MAQNHDAIDLLRCTGGNAGGNSADDVLRGNVGRAG